MFLPSLFLLLLPVVETEAKEVQGTEEKKKSEGEEERERRGKKLHIRLIRYRASH